MDVKRKGFISGFVLGVLVVFLFIAGLVLWQMGTSPVPRGNIVVTAWSRFLPLLPSAVYSAASGNFTVSFMNTVGTKITITNASVTDKLDESVVWSRPLINDVNPTANPQTMKPGSSFKLNANDNGAGKHAGDSFDLEITIQYTSVIGGISTNHTETGRIRGPVDY